MDRTERLLDLVALLLDSREPISWSEIRQAFPEDYGRGSDEAAERKFERDKAELLELGIPITYLQGDDERKDGYLINPEAYYLPEVGLTPEELAVLYAAGAAVLGSEAFPGSSDLAHALRKIRFFAGAELPSPKLRMGLSEADTNPELSAHLEQLWAAASSRKWVEILYFSPRAGETTRRRVDPYGLALRRGIWSLVGYCHLRKAVRTFHVHRLRELKVNPSRPRTPDFSVPEDFQVDHYVASYSWQHRFHAPMAVTLKLSGELSELGARAFPDGQVEPLEEGASTVRLTVRYLDGLLRYALSLGPSCQVVAPPDAAQKWREMNAKILSLHEGPVPQEMP
jgi:proteasome accessory factor B